MSQRAQASVEVLAKSGGDLGDRAKDAPESSRCCLHFLLPPRDSVKAGSHQHGASSLFCTVGSQSEKEMQRCLV